MRQRRLSQAERTRERQEQADRFIVADLVELSLSEVIEGRVVTDSRTGERKRIPGARKPKRDPRTLYNDPVRVLGHRSAARMWWSW